jgi:hypothetical protein
VLSRSPPIARRCPSFRLTPRFSDNCNSPSSNTSTAHAPARRLIDILRDMGAPAHPGEQLAMRAAG